ncbi:hypothetical protein J6590_091663, partial [Homalodisca vitripennis]
FVKSLREKSGSRDTYSDLLICGANTTPQNCNVQYIVYCDRTSRMEGTLVNFPSKLQRMVVVRPSIEGTRSTADIDDT